MTAPTPKHGASALGCTCNKLRRTTRRVTQFYDQALAASGLRVTQYSLLAHLRRSGGLSLTELAEKMAMDRTTLTRNLQPLVQTGYAKVRAGTDARTKALALTPRGERAFLAAVPLWRGAQARMRELLGDADMAALHGLLERSLEKLVEGEHS
jgi:DNA-binding MarR family transcriptional regulator